MTTSTRRLALATLALLTTAAGIPALAPPSSAGQHSTVRRHALAPDELWTSRSTDCDGADVAAGPRTGLALTALRSPQRLTGQGALAVETDGLAGALRRDTSYLGFALHARATSGQQPRAQWYVAFRDAVLTSAPVALTRGGWRELRIADATFDDGATWRGTMAEWVAEHGHGQCSAGVLTGACLDSPTVLVDAVRPSRWITDDLEPTTWVDVGERTTDGLDSGGRHPARRGQRITVTGQARAVDQWTGRVTPVADAPMVLQRQRANGSWVAVARRRTGDGGRARFPRVFRGPVTYRVVLDRGWVPSQPFRYVRARRA